MAKINVTLNASYGYDCSGCGYGSGESIEVEITDKELNAIREINACEVSREAIMNTIESGDSLLQPLHNKLDEACYYMVEEYWLFKADNELKDESIIESLESDVDKGVYSPSVSFEDFVEQFKDGEIELDDLEYDDFDDFDDIDEENLRYFYLHYISDEYYDWVCEHDHRFIAERVGLDIDSCREDEIDYIIHLKH